MSNEESERLKRVFNMPLENVKMCNRQLAIPIVHMCADIFIMRVFTHRFDIYECIFIISEQANIRGLFIVRNHDCLTNVEMADAPEMMSE